MVIGFIFVHLLVHPFPGADELLFCWFTLFVCVGGRCLFSAGDMIGVVTVWMWRRDWIGQAWKTLMNRVAKVYEIWMVLKFWVQWTEWKFNGNIRGSDSHKMRISWEMDSPTSKENAGNRWVPKTGKGNAGTNEEKKCMKSTYEDVTGERKTKKETMEMKEGKREKRKRTKE